MSHLLIFYLCDSLPSMNPYKALLLKKRSSLEKISGIVLFLILFNRKDMPKIRELWTTFFT
ncbi:predicted protein [Enterococcus faecium 1,230,933]|nr:predicted protein [Enterococcus faecium 1,230,933]